MFSLLYGFWEYMSRKEELRILILGLDKAGKTTLLERLKTTYTDFPGLDADKILPTVGLNVGRLQAMKSAVMFWDLGGQSGLRSIWDKYYADSHAIIYVVDAACPERMDEAKMVLDRVLGSRDLFDAPLLVVANKQDQVGAWGARGVEENLGIGVLDSRPTRVQPISAIDGGGVTDGIRWLLAEIVRSSRTSRLRKRAARNQ